MSWTWLRVSVVCGGGVCVHLCVALSAWAQVCTTPFHRERCFQHTHIRAHTGPTQIQDCSPIASPIQALSLTSQASQPHSHSKTKSAAAGHRSHKMTAPLGHTAMKEPQDQRHTGGRHTTTTIQESATEPQLCMKHPPPHGIVTHSTAIRQTRRPQQDHHHKQWEYFSEPHAHPAAH